MVLVTKKKNFSDVVTQMVVGSLIGATGAMLGCLLRRNFSRTHVSFGLI